uniref:Uncharacterized protein n=1 Tax=Lactuca sativa TaxID=4236 RepID=A0A9R1VQW9_LACSA|nr:hypothetical protein LSAT_V11C400194690 [Lactuca sativa]
MQSFMMPKVKSSSHIMFIRTRNHRFVCEVESSDLIAYGLIPEFVGRFPILDNLLALTKPQTVPVLPQPKNALGKRYNKLFQMNQLSILSSQQSIDLLMKNVSCNCLLFFAG